MKKWLIILGLLLLLLVAGFMVFTRLILPKAAVAMLPAKWQNIPLAQKKHIVHQYLGEPPNANAGIDRWEEKINSAKRYVLEVKYNADTIASNYSIIYTVKIAGFTNNTKLVADSIY